MFHRFRFDRQLGLDWNRSRYRGAKMTERPRVDLAMCRWGEVAGHLVGVRTGLAVCPQCSELGSYGMQAQGLVGMEQFTP